MSADAEEYHEKEKEQVAKFQAEKHQEIIQAAQGNSEMYQYFGDGCSDVTPKTKAKEKSRIRSLLYVNYTQIR